MNGRRGFLKLLTGGAAVSTVVNPKDALAMMKAKPVSANVLSDDTAFLGDAVGVPCELDPSYAVLSDFREALYHEESVINRLSCGSIPANIRTKKSWSPAFKEHVYTQEARQLQELIRRMEKDESFRKQLAGLLI